MNVVGKIEVKVNAADYDAAMELINAPGEDVDEAEQETFGRYGSSCHRYAV